MKAIHKYNNGNKFRGKTISDREKQRRILQSLQAQGRFLPMAEKFAQTNTVFSNDIKPHAPDFADVETIKL